MNNTSATLSTMEKALAVNLDLELYGTFAEIGAGQEVVRWFFQAGAAAGTISKSISAYDMTVSDAIYGACDRYVSRERLDAMLACEQDLNRNRLSASRGSATRFFTFADTVTARSYQGNNECDAWMGIRFQAQPGAEDDVVVIHARMLDEQNSDQQEALGIVGVNLVHSAFTLNQNPERMVASLLDGLSLGRIEIDMIDVSGPSFAGVDNRVLSLKLVELRLTDAAMFAADGTVLQPSEALRKRPLLIQRGRFRPITHVNMDLLQSARDKFSLNCVDSERELLPIMEMSLHNLMDNTNVCLEDFLSRAEVVATTGCTVMISDFREYHRLAAYLCRYTNEPVGLAMGLAALEELFKEKYYRNLEGGILEGIGRLFRNQVQLLVYPVKDPKSGVVHGLDTLQFDHALQHMLEYLRETDHVVGLDKVAHHHLDIHSPNVLKLISSSSTEWTEMVPDSVAEAIKSKKLFGYAA